MLKPKDGSLQEMKCSGSHFSNRQVNDTSTPQITRHFWIKSKSILSKAKSANCQSSSGGFSYAQELDNFRGEEQPRIPNWNLFFCKLINCQNESAQTHGHLNLFRQLYPVSLWSQTAGVCYTIPRTSLTLPGYAASLLSLLGH